MPNTFNHVSYELAKVHGVVLAVSVDGNGAEFFGHVCPFSGKRAGTGAQRWAGKYTKLCLWLLSIPFCAIIVAT